MRSRRKSSPTRRIPHFNVGAALLTPGGKVYTGCNIENAGYTATNTAPNARRCSRPSARASVHLPPSPSWAACRGQTNTLVTGPCGVCRQALYEFGGPGLTVIMAKSADDYIVTTLGELLPYGFGPANLESAEPESPM